MLNINLAEELKKAFPNKDVIPLLTREQFNAILPFEVEKELIMQFYETLEEECPVDPATSKWYEIGEQYIRRIPGADRYVVLEKHKVEDFFVCIKYTLKMSNIDQNQRTVLKDIFNDKDLYINCPEDIMIISMKAKSIAPNPGRLTPGEIVDRRNPLYIDDVIYREKEDEADKWIMVWKKAIDIDIAENRISK